MLSFWPLALTPAIAEPANASEPAAGSLATYTFTSPGWATFGLVLPRGEAFTGLRVGQFITQADVKNRWPDGSIRYAILTVCVEDTGSYDIYESAPATGNFTPLVPTARLELNIEGQTLYVSDLPATVSADLWLDGPLVKEWRVRDIPAHDGVEHPFLSNIWDVRVYSDGTGTVDATVENIRDVAEADGVVYGVDIYVNGAVAYHHAMSRPGKNPITNVGYYYSYTYASPDNGLFMGNYIRITSGQASGAVGLVRSFSNSLASDGVSLDIPELPNPSTIINESWETVFYHQYGARWHKKLDLNGFKQAFIKTDFSPFIEANAIPQYMPTVSNAATLRGYGDFEGADPLGISSLYVAMASGGLRAELGPYPEWAARFIVHQTPELLEQTLTMGDLFGSWSIHYAKNDPSQIVTLDEKPNYWLNGLNVIYDSPLNDFKGRLNMFYNTHAPSFAYIPYLVTGDRYYSDEMLFRASHAVLSTYPGYPGSELLRRGTQGMLWEQEMRGIAWGLRDVTDAAYYLPDGSQYKDYFMDILASNLKVMDERTINTNSPLGLPGFGASWQNNYYCIAPWQYAFFGWALQHTIEQGEPPINGTAPGSVVRDSIFRVLFEPAIIDTGFPPQYLPGYWVRFGTRVGASGDLVDYFTSWSEVYENNYVNEDGSTMPIGDWGYGYLIRIALIAAKKAGYPGVDKAYDYFMIMIAQSPNKYLELLPLNSAWAFADVPTAVRPTLTTVRGALLYQPSPRPVKVELYNSEGIRVAYAETDENGVYTLTAPAGGGYTLVITKPAYLSYTIKNLTLVEGEDIETIDMRQMGGDINGDGYIDSKDLNCLISEFGGAPVRYANADIDGDGLVNSVDLNCLLAGYGRKAVAVEWW